MSPSTRLLPRVSKDSAVLDSVVGDSVGGRNRAYRDLADRQPLGRLPACYLRRRPSPPRGSLHEVFSGWKDSHKERAAPV